MKNILTINSVSKMYKNGFLALKDISFSVGKEEIFALLGPNGAGKTTLISAVCGILKQSSGKIDVKGLDTIKDWRKTRKLIGLVPQELTLDIFESVWDSLIFSRGLFGKGPNKPYLEWLLDSLSLIDKKNEPIFRLSGGMKRRALIAKALAHEPELIFLDEPTAGVDVSLRKDMWELVKELRSGGATIILTTHYIEEAEEIADRVGIINKGKLLVIEEKSTLMQKMGDRHLIIHLRDKLKNIPQDLKKFNLELSKYNDTIIYKYDKNANRTGLTHVLSALSNKNIIVKDLESKQSSLEEVFLKLIKKDSK